MNTPLNPSPAQVLVIDDESSTIQLLAEALGSSVDVRSATSGVRALEVAAEQPPDVILLDVAMPGMDGFEVLRWLKAEPRTRHVPVILLAAADDIDDEQRGLSMGAVDFISKPISAALARARVRTQVELKRQRDLLEEHAALDGLTGIPNRRRFDAELDLRWRVAQRNGGSLLLALVDVDYFKSYNDHYGHAAGDDCLRQVAGALNHAFHRGDDFAARHDGEKFALLLPVGDGPAQATRVLQAIAALEIPHAYSSAAPRVTVSVGLLEVAPQLGDLPRQALEEAEGLRDEAKRLGRNCAVFLRHGDAEQQTILPEDLPA